MTESDMFFDWLLVGALFVVLFVGLYLYWIYGDSGGRDEE